MSYSGGESRYVIFRRIVKICHIMEDRQDISFTHFGGKSRYVILWRRVKPWHNMEDSEDMSYYGG